MSDDEKYINVVTVGHPSLGLRVGHLVTDTRDIILTVDMEEGLQWGNISNQIVAEVKEDERYIATLGATPYSLHFYEYPFAQPVVLEDTGTLVVEKNRKTKGHPQPFYRNGRW